ncbi:hypothetical protein LCGC14_0963690 [marine sediment metagenome]|uniref:Uncharacterized protein n=1 Tax=marine sediment metagenome TaxID=412755 RepID=A0A0F9QWX0_9ZZZZ
MSYAKGIVGFFKQISHAPTIQVFTEAQKEELRLDHLQADSKEDHDE